MGLFDYIFGGTKAGKWISHEHFYILGLALLVSGLSWSNAVMSIGQLTLLGNWILEGRLKNKFQTALSNRLVLVLISLYLMHLVGLAWTSDFDYAFKDLRIKLPLLFLPILFSSMPRLSIRKLEMILLVFLLTLFVVNCYSYAKLLGWTDEVIIDKRQLPVRISHIRYGLLMVMAIVLLLFYRFKSLPIPSWGRWLFVLWFVLAIVSFQLITALLILGIMGIIFLLQITLTSTTSHLVRASCLLTLILLIVGPAYFIYSTYQDFSQPPSNYYHIQNAKKLPTHTVNGNVYEHDLDATNMENGYYVWRYIQGYELQKEWEKRSELDYLGKDLRNQHLNYTLIRYLTSKGLTKDSAGFSQLNETDIKAVEDGIANHYYVNHSPLQNRAHKIFYEINEYQLHGTVNSHSIAMRFEYWKTAWWIIRENFWTGVGTGDIQSAFQQSYERNASSLEQRYRRRSHNQYLSIFATFGILGLLWFLFTLFYPLFTPQAGKIYLLFCVIALFSMLSEDTLESQAGVTFFGFFNTFLLFLLPTVQPPTLPDKP